MHLSFPIGVPGNEHFSEFLILHFHSHWDNSEKVCSRSYNISDSFLSVKINLLGKKMSKH